MNLFRSNCKYSLDSKTRLIAVAHRGHQGLISLKNGTKELDFLGVCEMHLRGSVIRDQKTQLLSGKMASRIPSLSFHFLIPAISSLMKIAFTRTLTAPGYSTGAITGTSSFAASNPLAVKARNFFFHHDF